MKILMIGQLPKEAGGNYTTGAAKVVYELSKQYVNDIHLHVFATNAADKTVKKNCAYPNQYIGYQFFLSSLLTDWIWHPCHTFKEWLHYCRCDHESPLRYAFYKANICRAINIVQPDIIHVHSISNISPAKFACKGKHIPLLLTCHGIFYRGDINDVKGRDIYQGNLPLCDYFTGLTEEARSEFTDILKVQPEKFAIIPNGVDTSKFYFSNEWREKIRQSMNVDDATVVFLTVASLQERKGQLDFIKVLEKLDIVSWQYWLIGIGTDIQLLEEYIMSHNLSRKVHLLGYRNNDELYKYYSAADIYAHSSWKEGQALSEIEAYATGLRTVANQAVIGTLVGDSIDNNLYHVIDFENIQIEKITKWLCQPSVFRKSRDKYSWQAIMEKYCNLYNQLTKCHEKTNC